MSAWIRAALVLPRLVTQLARTAVPPVRAAIQKVLSAMDAHPVLNSPISGHLPPLGHHGPPRLSPDGRKLRKA
ncbi:hypothetical protein SANTM175S_06888 [Streptomyces antimycoticus]